MRRVQEGPITDRGCNNEAVHAHSILIDHHPCTTFTLNDNIHKHIHRIAQKLSPMSGSGRTRANARKIGVLISESEPSVVGPLEQGVRAALKEAGILENSLEVRTVPGNFELPLVAWNMARRQQLVVLIVIACMPTKGDITVDSGDSVMKGLMEVRVSLCRICRMEARDEKQRTGSCILSHFTHTMTGSA